MGPYQTRNSLRVPDSGSRQNSASKIPVKKTPNQSGITPIRPNQSIYESKSPNKSGLTPVRPDRSPRTRLRHRSGLTPLRPDDFKGSSKSPFPLNPSGKKKSGLLPIKPETKSQNTASEYMGSSLAARRKSGLKPIRSGWPSANSEGSDSNSSLWLSGQSSFHGGPSNPSFNNSMRRKSGLAPLRNNLQRLGPRTNNAVIPHSLKKTTILNSQVKKFPPAEKDLDSAALLNTISEESDTRSSNCANLSGFGPLDDSIDASFHPPKSRLPKRVLQFSDEDVTATVSSNILKENGPTFNSVPNKSIFKKPGMSEEESLQQKRKTIAENIENLQSELQEIDGKLRLLRQNQSENDKEDTADSFGNLDSPCLVGPMELLTLEKSKKPENIYKVFRQSCSFLKTPKASAFHKEVVKLNQCESGTPNISRRLQQQLADLFDD